MAEGVVKSFFPEEGWGTISSAELPHHEFVWVHFSTIEMDGYRALDVGERVEFDYEQFDQDGHRYRAVTVRRRARGVRRP